MQIRPVETFAECERCIDLQKQIWGFSERDLIPARYLKTSQLQGGSVLAAFDGQQLAGFTFAQPSIHDGRLAMHSYVLAVAPAWQNRGLGHQLKLAQRQDATHKNIELITWTYDPLQARNANLNINKLGVLVRRYLPDVYGPASSSRMHGGLGTDRFLAEWWIQSPRVLAALEAPGLPLEPLPDFAALPLALQLLEGRIFGGAGELRHLAAAAEGSQVLVEIPWDLNHLMQEDMELAWQWRQVSKETFQVLFHHGFVVTRLLRAAAPHKRVAYLLERYESRLH